MNVGVTGLITYLRERDENPNSSRVNNVGNVQGSTVPVMGTVTRNIEVGESSAENHNQTYNNERPAGYPDASLNMYRDELRVKVSVGEPYFEQPRVEINKETYADDALEMSLTEMHIKGMMEKQKMNLEEENIISMIMIQMGIIGMIEILGIIGMTGIGFKNHKGMSLRNPTRMSGRR